MVFVLGEVCTSNVGISLNRFTPLDFMANLRECWKYWRFRGKKFHYSHYNWHRTESIYRPKKVVSISLHHFHLANTGPYMSPRNDSLNGRQLLQGEHNLHILFQYIYIAEIVFEIILATKIASVNTMRYPFAVIILYKQYEAVFAIKNKNKQTN